MFQFTNESLRILDSIAASDTATDYSMQRDSLINELNILQQTRVSLVSQHHAFAVNNVDAGLTLNASITPAQLPETNEQFMNQVSALYYLYGKDSVSSYYSQILDVALQCPDAGGKAVYRARPFVEMFNDSVEYNDVDVCHQAGIYRAEVSLPEVEKGDIQIIPNPASDKIEIKSNCAFEGICLIEITDALGSVAISEKINCKQQSHVISTSHLKQGIYFVRFVHEKIINAKQKLIIIR